MKQHEENQMAFPGWEEEAPATNGNGRPKSNGHQPGAELAVPQEIDVELHTRTFYKGRQHTGKWHDTVFKGNNMDVLGSMPDETVDLILTDPPYNINYASNRRVKNRKYKPLANDNTGDWIPDFAREAYRVLKNDRHLYCFCRHDTYPEFIAALQDAGFKLKRTLIWVKNNHGSGDLTGDYAPQDEWIIFCHKGRRKLFNGRHSNILHYSKLSTKNQTHSTEKPVELLKFLIGKSTEEGELVLDPFSGSGSTMHAAKEMNRYYCTMELSSEYAYTTEQRRILITQGTLVEKLYEPL
ncbi:site-specific DNA-methyltransferase [bacterium]|nr:site-specific DNA-methyltransferase [bacterium]